MRLKTPKKVLLLNKKCTASQCTPAFAINSSKFINCFMFSRKGHTLVKGFQDISLENQIYFPDTCNYNLN